MNPVHEVDTQLGKLVVYESRDPEYPGIHILLRRNNHELLLAVVESGESPFHKNPRLQLTIYGDPLEDEPTHVADIEPNRITKCLAEIFWSKGESVMPTKLIEHTYGTHTYMRIRMPDGIIEEIDVYWLESGPKYKVTSTSEERCQEIIEAFKELY